MRLARFIQARLVEIATGEMPPLTRKQRKRGFQYVPWQRFHADEDGKISFISIFTVLAFILFIGLIMNATVSVKEKIEMQNAADTGAYTANLWRARGMNAITTINHLMGEQTALLTILDGFGGDLLGDSEIEVQESKTANEALKSLYSEGNPAPPISEQSKIGKILREFDLKVVEACYKRMTEDKGRHKAGAAIYDAKLQLKSSTKKIFAMKIAINPLVMFAGVLEETGFPPAVAIGYFLDAGCAALHVELSKELIELTKERVMIDLAEALLEKIDRKLIEQSLRDVMFRALTLYADSIVGSTKGKPSPSLVTHSIQNSMQKIQAEHRLANMKTDPTADKIQLPIIAEHPPVLRKSNEKSKSSDPALGPWSMPDAGWSGDFRKKSEAEKIFDQITAPFKQLGELVDKIEPLVEALEYLDETWGKVKNAIPFPEEPKGLEAALGQLGELKKLAGNISIIRGLAGGISKSDHSDGFEGNPSKSVKAYKIEEFYWDAERHSQWTRATYPYVNDYRSGLLHLMKDHLWRSNIATHYAKWTNRYTLANSFAMRKDVRVSSSKKDTNILDQLKRKIREIRRRFDDALDSSDEEASGSLGVAPFEELSDELYSFVKEFSVPPGFEKWKQDVIEHQAKAIAAGNTLSPRPDDDITGENLKALGTQIARINLLDELLTLLEELADSLEVKPPHMYIMKYMDGKNKGIEPWTGDNKLAEQLFCVRTTATRNGQRIFMSPVFYSQYLAGERASIAESMLYNANGRVIQGNADTRFQANTGWDTLNWELPVEAFEWGKHEPSVDPISATEIFTNGRRVLRNARSKINWQSKLTPFLNTKQSPETVGASIAH